MICILTKQLSDTKCLLYELKEKNDILIFKTLFRICKRVLLRTKDLLCAKITFFIM